ncbi:hypothetical protein [Thermococcus profundus]|uniref:hypothetical protein n=1 Tax=Thermococcus profundus TaxID=49899 RepID=UPI003002B6A0
MKAMSDVNWDEIEFLADILNRHPIESLRRIAEIEGIDYYRLKRIYDKYYGKYVTVNAMYNIKRIGLRSYIAFLSVPKERLRETAIKLRKNPFFSMWTLFLGSKTASPRYFTFPKSRLVFWIGLWRSTPTTTSTMR